jgi:hypothetical protein
VATCLTVTPTGFPDVICKDCIRQVEVERFVEKLNNIQGLSYLDYRLLKNINTGLVQVAVKIHLLIKSFFLFV